MGVRITIVGAGPGGYAAAVRAAQLGAEVTLVEQAEVGGTCLHWGCIPTKVMREAAELRERMETAGDFGIRLSESPKVDLLALAERKQSVIRAQTDGILKLLARHRVRVLRGAGFAEAPGLVIVRTPSGETLELPGERLILALGSRPADLRALPRDGRQVLSSNDALELDCVARIPGDRGRRRHRLRVRLPLFSPGLPGNPDRGPAETHPPALRGQ